jgi:hypothetical protein
LKIVVGVAALGVLANRRTCDDSALDEGNQNIQHFVVNIQK